MALSFKGKRLILKAIATARRFRFWLAAGVAAILFFQIVAFTPKRLEEETAPEAITQQDLKPREEEGSFVAPTLPQDEVPEYTVDGFQYVSIENEVKQWRLEAERAYFYQAEGIVHARDVKADLYDEAGNKTIVTSKEAKYFMISRNLELFGDVHTIFPVGIEARSQYMHYAAEVKEVSVPVSYPVDGNSVATEGKREKFEFRSKGLKYRGNVDLLYLLSEVNMRIIKETPNRGTEVTHVDSDQAEVDKKNNIAKFSMFEARPPELRFVKITQPGMTSHSRRAEFRINSSEKKLRTIRALDDVKIVEKPPVPSDYATNARRRSKEARSRYATAGIAEFDTEKNLIVLRDYPQVYQDHDTITGETIIVHRNSDLVEVDQSNAYSEGQDQEEE